MPRRKPTSARQKKAEIQLKRAVKRGDVPPPEIKKNIHHRHGKATRIGPTGLVIGSSSASSAAVQAVRRLQSAFITLSPKFLEETKTLASTFALPRPLHPNTAVFSEPADLAASTLSCPRRPKWRFDMTKKEVEHNEEGVFKQWINQTSVLAQKWQDGNETKNLEETGQENDTSRPILTMPRSPTYFERNLEVWRQLWRVTEISQIILVLLDSRCPLLHYPQSLSSYLSNRKHVLVLTKVDVAGAARVEAWTRYLNRCYPGLRIVPVESYIEEDASLAHQGRKQFEPYIPECFRKRLVEALKELHEEMLEPPEKVKSNPAWLKEWKPLVKRDVDWEALMTAGGSKLETVTGGPTFPRPKEDDGSAEEYEDQEPEFLTIGLIGQPNVGKSSLLNALFGAHKVRASKTPGKTKHFQTLFWTSDVRLVDCPGLVMPSLVSMEMQVLSGILPISRVSAIPACIYHAARLLPLELIYKLAHPSLIAPPVKDKRTWREGKISDPTDSNEKPLVWTAMDVLTAYANSKGWVTAKAGRPDVHRAGNAILRSLAEAKIGWAFWPPGSDPDKIVAETQEGAGIWIPGGRSLDEESSDESEGEEEEEDSEHDTTQDRKEDAMDKEDEDDVTEVGFGRFGALVLDDNGQEEDEEDY